MNSLPVLIKDLVVVEQEIKAYKKVRISKMTKMKKPKLGYFVESSCLCNKRKGHFVRAYVSIKRHFIPPKITTIKLVPFVFYCFR